VADNLSAHKAKGANEYFESMPGRFALHFIPTHSSWLNLAGRWLAEITNKQIRRGSYESVAQLTKSIKDFIKSWNKPGRAFK
jgi:transposase